MALQHISQLTSFTINGVEQGVLNNSFTYTPSGNTLEGQVTDQGANGDLVQRPAYGTVNVSIQWFNIAGGLSSLVGTSGNVISAKSSSGLQVVFDNCWINELPSGNLHESGAELRFQHMTKTPEIGA